MAHAPETLTVAVSCGLSGGGSTFGTGVPVAMGFVLTARHVVVHPEIADKPVRVRFWHATEREFSPDPDGSSNGFVDAVVDPDGTSEERRGVVWASEALDAALVRVPHPPSIGIATLAGIDPYNNAAWQTEAFPDASWEYGDPRPIRLTGKSHSRFPNEPRYQVDAEIPMTRDGRQSIRDPDGWSGASGASLFVNGQVMGILLVRRANAAARVLKAVPVVDLMSAPGFGDCVGATHASQHYLAELEKIFSDTSPRIQARVAQTLGFPDGASPSDMAEKLGAIQFQDGISLLRDVFQDIDEPIVSEVALRLAACHCGPQNADQLRRSVFARNPDFDNCAAGTKMGAEFLMAGAERRLPAFAPAIGPLPSGRYALPRLPESGAASRDAGFSRDLEARIGADLLQIESSLDESIGPVCDFPMDSPDQVEVRRQMLQHELNYRSTSNDPQPSYYFAEPDPGPTRAAERDALAERIRRLRESYPQIATVYIRPDMAPAEFARFRPIAELLPLERRDD